MKQVLASMRPKDGDTVSRLDRTSRTSAAGTSGAGRKPARRSTEEEWVRSGPATVFVSVEEQEPGGPLASTRSPPWFCPDKEEELKARGTALAAPPSRSTPPLSLGARAFIVKGRSAFNVLQLKFLHPGSLRLLQVGGEEASSVLSSSSFLPHSGVFVHEQRPSFSLYY